MVTLAEPYTQSFKGEQGLPLRCDLHRFASASPLAAGLFRHCNLRGFLGLTVTDRDLWFRA